MYVLVQVWAETHGWNLSLLKDLYSYLFFSPCTGAVKMTAYMLKALSCCVVRGDVVSIELDEVDVFHLALHEVSVRGLVHSQDFD